jgi:IMP dehydrogenase/GMP reductase
MKKDIKLDWNDVTIVPAELSSISSRSEINPYTADGKLPLFTAPMDTVIDDSNIKSFIENGINICLPRHVKYEELKNESYFYSYGLDEIIELIESDAELPRRVLIDVANGHMQRLYDVSKQIKEKYGDQIELMVGNIANPNTYRKYCEIGVDYIRVGIGGGSACTTSANVGVHYPMASLIEECAMIKCAFDKPTKIIADGGFKNYSDIIKALALGADYVMLGGIFNKNLESCGKIFLKDSEGQYYEVDSERALSAFNSGVSVYKYYRGMSTKEVQKSWNRKELKTGEGITKYNLVDSTLEGWTENFTDYLKSQMSYVGARNLDDFVGEVDFVQITQNAFMRFNK